MSLVPEQAEFLKDVCMLVDYASKRGFLVTGGELYRTAEQQDIYVRTGRSKTMNSYHLRRLAIDLNFFINSTPVVTKEELQEIGDYWVSLNPKNQWGGNWNSFKDLPHFERRV